MLKNKFYIIIIVVQVVASLLFLMYAFIQKAKADKRQMQAQQSAELAREIQYDCEKMERTSNYKIDSLQQVIQVLKKE